MEIKVPPERVLLLKDQLSDNDAEKIAWKNKTNAFGAFHQVASFLSRPKDEDFTLVYKEHRYVPFLHIKGSAKYVYDRTVVHEWPTSGPEVQRLTLADKEYGVKNEMISVSVVEHCREESHEELFVDGLTDGRNANLMQYLRFAEQEIKKEELENLAKDNVVLPPHTRTSGLVREIASKMIQNIEADKILEEDVSFEKVDTYYRSLFVYKYHWESKDRDAVIFVDALTGEVSFSTGDFKQLMGNVFDYDFLFDIGKDAAGIFIPGGSIAVKVAKKYIDVTQSKANKL